MLTESSYSLHCPICHDFGRDACKFPNDYFYSQRGISRLLKRIRETENSELDKMPPEVVVNVQTGYLLGYADCWKKFAKALGEKK